MNIRRGIKEDVKSISKFLKEMWFMHVDNEPKFINRKVIKESDLASYFEDTFNGSNKSFLLIAEEKDEFIGLCKVNIQELQRFFNETKILYIDDIYVVKDFRKKGVAGKLLKEAEVIAKQNNIKWVKARVYEFNKPGQKMMDKSGYKSLYSEYFKILS